MDYLYGDSTGSPLKSNFLEFFRDALDFGVFVLQADARIKQRKERMRVLRDEAGVEMQRLHAFIQTVLRAIDKIVPKGALDSPTTRCATQVTALAMEGLRASLNSARDELAKDSALAEAEEQAERAACTNALRTLLAPHDPPDASSATRLVLNGGTYEARAVGASELGLAWTFALAIPDAHLWAAPVLLDKIKPQLEIQTPQLAGWRSKEVSVRPQKLERLVVAELVDAGSTVRIALREPGNGAGFDITVEPEAKHVRIDRVGAKEDPNGPFEVVAEDVAKLLDLASVLRAAAGELKRDRFVSATFDGADFGAQPTFIAFVQRFIAMMAPIVRAIAERSPSSNELVIRRLLGNDRREEIFVTTSSLREKYAPLPEKLRRIFAPLGLDPALTGATPSAPPEEPIELLEDMDIIAAETIDVAEITVDPDLSPEVGAKEEALVASLRHIVGLARVGSVDDAYREYAALFSSPIFAEHRSEGQRRALKLMVTRTPPATTNEAAVDAHRAAMLHLQALVDRFDDPADYEMLGMAHLILNDTAAASATFSTALALERARNPDSDLCGKLKERVAATG